MSKSGAVFLVGAGPGSEDFLTLAAVKALRAADVVLYDALVQSEILRNVRRGAEKIFVGKRRHLHFKEQDQINKMLLQFAKQGKCVVRLKGGDPYIFGRGGEEFEFLRSRGVRVQCIPGISSALSVPALAGIPLTHRNLASSFLVMSGPDLLRRKLRFNYDARRTLVVLMAFEIADSVIQVLLNQNWPKKTPCALIARGSWPEEKRFFATLGSFSSQWKKNKDNFESPALLVVGRVVRLGKIK